MLLRWPTEDPRLVLLAQVNDPYRVGDVIFATILDGPLKGRVHTQAQTLGALSPGDVVRIVGLFAERVAP